MVPIIGTIPILTRILKEIKMEGIGTKIEDGNLMFLEPIVKL